MDRFYPGDTVRIKTGKSAGRIGTVLDFERNNGKFTFVSGRCRVLIWNNGKRSYVSLKAENIEFVSRPDPVEE